MTSAAAAPPAPPPSAAPRRVLVFGATGTAGAAAAQALLRRGHEVVCFVREGDPARLAQLAGAELRFGDVTDAGSLARDAFCGERFDAVVSCLASRTGAPADAWRIDHRANMDVLVAAQEAGVGHFVLLSAICVQKPRLAFQHAKLAFEAALVASDLRWSSCAPPPSSSRWPGRSSG